MSGPRVFLTGPLLSAPLRTAILGAEPAARPLRIADHALRMAGARVGLVAEPGAVTEGLVLDLDPEQAARLDWHQTAAGLRPLTLVIDGDAVLAHGLDPATPAEPWEPWEPGAWQARWGDTVRATAGDVLALRGTVPVAAVRARYRLMLVHGASCARAAAEPLATSLRHRAGPDDLAVAGRRQPYANFFAVAEYDLSFRRFDGRMSPVVNRAAFISGDAVTVLPYDPVRDRVLLVEQFRAGPFARGAQPWQLEPIAGRIDPGETPEDTARREAVEEAGLALGALLKVADYYPTPGAKAEFVYAFVALADLPDGCEGVFGMEGEAEDIRGHLVPFEHLMALVASGEVATGTLLLSALWLQRERPRLRAESR